MERSMTLTLPAFCYPALRPPKTPPPAGQPRFLTASKVAPLVISERTAQNQRTVQGLLTPPNRHNICSTSLMTRMMQFLLFCAAAVNGSAQLEVSSSDEQQACFGGEGRTIRIFVRNAGAESEERTLRTRVYQASSSTIMPVAEAQPWKKLTVLGGQTLLESATVNFPEVRAVTRFHVRWLDDGGKSIGQTRV